MQRKLTKEEFVERMKADKAEERKQKQSIYFGYVKERVNKETKKI